MLHLYAALAEKERNLISTRTKAALAAAKARGVQLGGNRGHGMTEGAGAASLAARKAKATERAVDLAPMLDRLRSEGNTSASSLAKALTAAGIPTARGGSDWTAIQVFKIERGVKTRRNLVGYLTLALRLHDRKHP